MAATYDEINWIGVGSAVRDRRSESGLSAEDAALKLCLSKKQILALESGSSAPFPGATVRSWCGHRYAVMLGLDWEHLVQAPPGEDRAAVSESMQATACPIEPGPAPETRRERYRGRLLLSGPVLALIAVITYNTALTDASAPASTPAAKIAPKVNSPVVVLSSADTASAGNSAAPVDWETAARGVASVAASPAEVSDHTQTSPASTSAAVETVVEIQGRDPAKQTGSFFVSSKEHAALLKKMRSDPGAGIRIDLPQGAERRIPISPNEIVRVAEGRNLAIFYQGRMVPAQVVDSGAWVNFVRKTADSSD
ncbi:MAG: helix-turn-helix domain-containing protein [Burkholderiales bacterium]